jgi:LmbE family N-acetylglucosaminyl deacetylase
MVVAPHCDDETIGCGGLIAEHAALDIKVVVMASGSVYYPHMEREVGLVERRSELEAALLVLSPIKVIDYTILFPERESYLDTVPQRDLVGKLEAEIKKFKPDTVLLPYGGHHQDHRATYWAALAACRPRPGLGIKLLATYEYPYAPGYHFEQQSGGWMYVDISEHKAKKVAALKKHQSQTGRSGMLDAVRVLAEQRGAEIGVEAAERFQVLRWIGS